MLVTHRRDRVQLLLPLIIVDCQPPIITIKPAPAFIAILKCLLDSANKMSR